MSIESKDFAEKQAPAEVSVRGENRFVIRHADVVTMEAGALDLMDTDVLVVGEPIAAVERNIEIEGVQTIDMGGVVPTFLKGYKQYHEWKMKIMPAMNAGDAYHGQYLGCLEAIDSGVTSMVDFSHGLHTQEMALEGARGVIDSGIAGFFCWQIAHVLTYGLNEDVPCKQGWDDRCSPPTEMHWETSKILRDEYFGVGRSPSQFGIALSNSSFGHTMEMVKEEFRRARELGPRLITHHVRSTRADPPYPEGYFRTVKDLADAGLIGPDYHLTHANDWSDEELRIMADHGGAICSTPQVETLHKAEQTVVFARFASQGGRCGLGLDVPHAYTRDYFEMIRTAFWACCRTEQSREIINSWNSNDLLAYATREAAKSVNLGDEAGTITVGKYADLVLLDTSRIGFSDWGTLADRVVNFASLQDIDSVWIRGKLRKSGGKMLGIGWAALKSETAERQARIRRDMNTVNIVL
ncbi:amidohydrolase family protein [Agrobacterium tumefaciens]|uniref:amidohydrolase family protein n=1 Tax=Agrobacterium tumefaciens TaxID=358 RepID=UPI0018860C06|nr:amidohydrolase family protein [Agrobacterium tumefaciens]